MISPLLMSAPVLVQPFVLRPPSLVPRLAQLPWAHSRQTATATASASHQMKAYSRKRRNNFFLQSSKSDDNDDENTVENQVSDAALFCELTAEESRLTYGGDDEDGEDGEDITDGDPYAQIAPSEFSEKDSSDSTGPPSPTSLAKAIARQSRELNISPLDWGGALSTLRSRVSDIESGKSIKPSTALFRTISRERPNEAIGRFVREANPEVVSAMTGAVTSLLGSLSNPAMGMEMIVQASGEKLGSLCFQLMMTGYMFRNAEYVVALKSLMNIGGGDATLDEYRRAFERFDTDGSGYLERDEIEALLSNVYEGQPPAFEIETFLEFFDSNNDGRVSWEEFEKGFGVVAKMGERDSQPGLTNWFSLPGSVDAEEDEEDIDEPSVTGTIQVEMSDGRTIQVDAQEYMNDLKQQALELKMELKRELAQEKGMDPNEQRFGIPSPGSSSGILSYVASLQGDVKSLTSGIGGDVVESMKMLIDYVLEGTPIENKKKEMELPGSALQQLALWQLVIGYRLREAEATGEWKRMLE